MQTFDEFWSFYLNEHRHPLTRALHMSGTSLSVLIVVCGVALRQPLMVIVGPAVGYAFSWVGHFFVEHNRPATFKHPLWSFRADFKMLACAVTGRLPAELQRAGVSAG